MERFFGKRIGLAHSFDSMEVDAMAIFTKKINGPYTGTVDFFKSSALVRTRTRISRTGILRAIRCTTRACFFASQFHIIGETVQLCKCRICLKWTTLGKMANMEKSSNKIHLAERFV